MGIEKTEKILQIRNQLGRSVRVVREHYLREDVPCLSQMCVAQCSQTESCSLLPSDVTHYVVPDCQISHNYMEILELPELRGVIFMQTVANYIQHDGGRRLYRRLNQMVKDPRKNSVVFCNEFHKYAYVSREPGVAHQRWQNSNIYSGAVWYYDHLVERIPIVIVSDNAEFKEEYGYKRTNVFVLSLKEYLDTFWPSLQSAYDLHESLTASLEEAETQGSDGSYSSYLPAEVLDAGLKVGRFIQGRLTVNKHNAQNEAFVTPMGASGKEDVYDSDILISGGVSRNRSVHGDLVVVQVLPKTQWKKRSLVLRENDTEEASEGGGHTLPTGQVVGVLQRQWRDYVCSFSQDEVAQRKAGKVIVTPFDWRIPRIRISTSQAAALKDHRILVRIDSWEASSQYPNGHFVRSMGKAGELETEIACLLVENNISVPAFSEGQLKELPVDTSDHPWEMDPKEVTKRRDIRQSHLVFSIDPKGCEDVDDTLSVRQVENGHIEVGVHIADVTHFVAPGSLTDLEASSRSTTVYLADRRYDMLPGVLSANLCSLLGGVDRYAMSVIWELDQSSEVVDVWYGRTIIRSSYKLFYEIAQDIYDGASSEHLVENIPELQEFSGDELQNRLEKLKWCVEKLTNIARQIRARRGQEGALELEGVEVSVQMDKKDKTIEDLLPKQPLEVHETIAEWMIFANHWVAKKICEAFPKSALLRHHPLPRQDHFDSLITCAASKGFTIDSHSNKALAESLDKCVDPKDPEVNKLLRSLATQAMSNASYFSTGSLPEEQYFHYGLALDKYTHFTSPIRRYADVVVHRLLMAALGQESMDALPGNKSLQELAEHINKKHRAAQYAQRESTQLFQMLFFKQLPAGDPMCLADAIIFQLRPNGVLVFVPRYGLKGAVYLRSKEGAVVFVDSNPGGKPEWTGGQLALTDQTITVHSTLGSQEYRLFDHITVEVSVNPSHVHMASLNLTLVSNHPHNWQSQDTPDSKQGRSSLIQAVRTEANERSERETAASRVLGSHMAQLMQMYGQTPPDASLYTLYQNIEDLAMRETTGSMGSVQ